MTERPILFSGPMVRAILAGAKTQTRRVVTHIGGIGRVGSFGVSDTPGYMWQCRDTRAGLWHDLTWKRLMRGSPYGVPGDRLWVREAFRYYFDEPNLWDCIQYRADGVLFKPEGLSNEVGYRFDVECEPDSPWKPSIHMPRWASRITLEVVSVRVQRVQDISPEDAEAEGAWRSPDGCGHFSVDPPEFRDLWDSTNAKRGHGWADNPWVWAITFRVLKGARA